ncbi:MAG: DNA polymerase III subunit delta' [Rhodocyclaceae bacterium]|nr:DNA polymerase III subunit delta' [Rhodocyclaceae bacterium]
MEYFSWHAPAWDGLFAVPGTVPAAMLVAGEPGWGQDTFSQALAARLLCDDAQGSARTACGACESCRWLAAGTHPDFRLVVPEADVEEAEAEEGTTPRKAEKKKSTQIRIEQIRALEDFVFTGSHRRGNRVIVLDPAEAMNLPAANSLLKILEEPPATVYFILSSSSWRRLLPTIISRCRRIAMPRPTREQAMAWLGAQGTGKEAATLLPILGGAPVAVREWIEDGRAAAARTVVASLQEPENDPVMLAARWATLVKDQEGLNRENLVTLIQRWVHDLLLFRLSGQVRFMSGQPEAVEKAARGLSIPRLLACYNELLRIRAVSSHPLNAQLFLEDLAARFLMATLAKS